jgi:thymidine phosphorylase
VLPQELIRRKRDGATLSPEEIAFVVDGITTGRLTEGQIAAFAMAVFFRGLSMPELTALTVGMAGSGTRLAWHDGALPGPVVDKHSSGGVGDKVSLMLAPIVAACGGFVPMISGRGLGHTGGTLDKMSAIPGYRVQPDLAEFRSVVGEVGCAIVGQTDDLAPADRRLYAIRDVTGTVESVPLLVSSILSKKLAAGLDGLVMDVKMGSGAFAAEAPMARELAEALVAVGKGAGLPMVALITDMNAVLGTTVGNAVEVAETIAYLTGDGPRDPRLHDLVITLAAEMLVLGRIVPALADGRARAEAALADGSAAERFAHMVRALGGPRDVVDRTAAHLATAPCIRACTAARSGRIEGMDARQVGVAVVALGGGRTRPTDAIDPAVGLTEVVAVGTTVHAGDPLAIVHAASPAALDAADAILRRAIHIGDAVPVMAPIVHARIVP